ncbi:MAG: OmpA family protein [Paludibacteraceae bacterium]|nr:OmpA family protein [Paludibacteraceae bacterium]MBN2786811.1 OmpA family protein [Paludibacteraceae bacterium]
MNFIKKITFIALLLPSINSVSAQETLLKPWCPDWCSNWFINVSGGAQVLFSSDASTLELKDRITPAISLSVGKWVSPFMGIRIKTEGYSLNGFSTTDGLYLADPVNDGTVYGNNDPVRNEVTIRPDGSYRHYLRYINAHADIQFSVLNCIKGYSNNRNFDLYPSVGAGYFQTFEYKGIPSISSISTNLSLQAFFTIHELFDLTFEVGTTILPDKFDGRISKKQYENISGVSLGITYHLGKKGFNPKIVALPAKKELITQIKHDTVIIEKKIEVDKSVTAKKDTFALASIRFKYAHNKPYRGQEIQFINIVNYLNLDAKNTIFLDGYGDKNTGNPDVNLQLSAERANNVKELLIKKYGIDSARIIIQAHGDKSQPYEKNNLNRVVIVKITE